MLAYRSTRRSSTGFTPAYLHNGRELRLPPQVVFPASSREPQMVTDYARQLRNNLQQAFYAVSSNLQTSHEETKDRSHHYANYCPYEIDDFVYVLTPKGSRGKLGDVWCGRTMESHWSNWCFVYIRTHSARHKQKKKTRRYHYNLLKYCLPQFDDYLQSSPSNLTEDVEATPPLPEQKRNIVPPNRYGEWDYSISD